MGDAKGPFFGSCEKWSHESNQNSMGQCQASLSTGAKIAIGVCVPLAVIIIVVIVVVVVRKKKRGRSDYDVVQGFK
jgi:hydrogenase-4 membrane subunit HyfE